MGYAIRFIGICFLMASCHAFSEMGDYFDLAKNRPSEFLNFLITGNESGAYTIREPIAGWIKKRDIPHLISLLDSKEKCRPIVLVYSSRLPLWSTVGDEAALLIMGFRKNRYPPELSSRPISDVEKKEIIKWWRILENSPD